MDNNSVIITRDFDVPIHLVWRAITDKDWMKEWYIDVPEFKTYVGFKFEFWGGEQGERKWNHLCEITEVIPQTKLAYTWKYEGYDGMSEVSFELSHISNGTKLKFEHTGIDTFPVLVEELSIENFEIGWNQAINVTLVEFLSNKRNNWK